MRQILFAVLCSLCVAGGANAQPTPDAMQPPVRNLSPSAGAQQQNVPKQIPLGEAMKNKPLKFIEVGELPPVNSTSADAQDLASEVDPNTLEADAFFTPTALSNVSLRGIKKLTGRVQSIAGKIKDTLRFGDLEMVVYQCSSVLDQGEPGYAALVEVTEFTKAGKEQMLFRGWLFSTSPSLSSLQHPKYDLLLAECS